MEAFLSFPPSCPDPSNRFLFFVHGRIVETDGPHGVSPDFGPYRYFDILQALNTGDHVLVSEQRDHEVDAHSYAKVLASRVEGLLSAGVSADAISVAGFSKGGYITLLAAKLLQNDALKFVILAGCTPGLVSGVDEKAEGLRGRVLSMVDYRDDRCFSCGPLFSRNPQLRETSDIVFSDGDGHGHFFRPGPDWIGLTLDWSRR